MSKLSRNAQPDSIRANSRTVFVTVRAKTGRSLLQSEWMANLFIDVLHRYVAEQRFKVDDFVVMPNHVHLLLTLDETISIEKAVQLIKGKFSYRVKKEFGFPGEVWKRGFSESRIDDRESFLKRRKYIDNKPVKAGLARAPEKYPYGSAYFRKRKKRSG